MFPAVNKRVSPGKMKPISNPVSIKMMPRMPMSPNDVSSILTSNMDVIPQLFFTR